MDRCVRWDGERYFLDDNEGRSVRKGVEMVAEEAGLDWWTV